MWRLPLGEEKAFAATAESSRAGMGGNQPVAVRIPQAAPIKAAMMATAINTPTSASTQVGQSFANVVLPFFTGLPPKERSASS